MGVKAIFGPFCIFFHGQKSFFTPTFFHFFGIFHGHFFFSRPLLRFFSRVKNMVSRPKFQEFSRIFLLLTGRILDFFHVHYFSFHGCNFRKFSRAKIDFHGHFYRILPYFQGEFTPKKNTVFKYFELQKEKLSKSSVFRAILRTLSSF